MNSSLSHDAAAQTDNIITGIYVFQEHKIENTSQYCAKLTFEIFPNACRGSTAADDVVPICQ